MTRTLAFTKMSGAGNDFVVLEAALLGEEASEELAARLCARRHGIGADGLLVVGAPEGGIVPVDYRNADGSPAAFCGNGARCAALFAAERLAAPSAGMLLDFPGARAAGRVLGPSRSEVALPRPVLEEQALELPLGGALLRARLVRAGVPHLVVVDAPGGHDALEAIEAAFRESGHPFAGRANVTSVVTLDEGRLSIATLELGSGRTLACGSATMAAVAALETPPGSGARFTLTPPSGVPLDVELEAGAAGHVRLAGEARVVFEGSILL